MPKKLAVLGTSLVFAATLALPLSASAEVPPYTGGGLTETQKSAIISLLESFGADPTTIANVKVALGMTPPLPTSCVDLTAQMTLGSTDRQTGGQVTMLQNYLINKGYLGAEYNTGYYGFLTAQAVGKLQLSLGIVSSENDTSYGITGPKTRAAISCGTTPPPPPSTTFSALPTSGDAPLTVRFSGLVNSVGYSIDFGDGTTSGDIGCSHGGCPIASTLSLTNVNVSHTYTSAGSYTAKLRRHFSTNEGNCAGVDCNVVGTVITLVATALY